MKIGTFLLLVALPLLLSVSGIVAAHPYPSKMGLPPSYVGASPPGMDSNDDSLHIYDIQHYDIHLDVDIVNQVIHGDVSILCVSTDNSLDQILLELKSLTVDTVRVDGLVTWFSYYMDSLFVPLSAPLPEGDSVLVEVIYHGHPAHESWGGFWFQSQRAYTLGDGLYVYPPPYNHTWFPNWRHPADKATADLWFSIPINMVAASNGELVEYIQNPPEQTVTYHWRQNEPISSYLYCVAIADYVVMQDSVLDWVENYVYPSYQSQALVSFSNVHVMMEGYEQLFGPYPFTGKFGYAMTGNGDMEHAGLVSHVYYAVNGQHNYDHLLAHEMSHMWWGDWVTCGTWKDLWLNEGFASYCEALFSEYAYGEQAYRNYVSNPLMSDYFNSGELFPIYNPQQLWTETVYQKGGCVMHMLRGVLGDSLFFAGWNEYGARYQWDTATTEDFQTVMEEISGQDLDWFFDEWIYGPGYPRYNYSWNTFSQGDTWGIHLWVDQIQTVGGPFTMPIRIAAISSVDTVIQTVWIHSDPDTVDFPTGHNEPVALIFDYHNWVLDVHTEVPSAVTEGIDIPTSYSLHPAYPNPFNSSTVIEFSVPVTCRTHLAVYNILGQKVTTLLDGVIGAGEHTIRWDGTNNPGNDVASGVYLIGMDAQSNHHVEKVVLLR
jgi:aminopeptidase N